MVVNFNCQTSYVHKMFADSNAIEFEFWKKNLGFFVSKKVDKKLQKISSQFTKWFPPISTLRACWNSGGCSDFKWRHMLLVELLDRLIICPQRLHFELCLSCCFKKNFQTAEGVCPPPLAPPVLTMLTRRRGGFGVDFCFFADPFFIGVTSSFFPIWDWTKNRYLSLLKQEHF